jgi:hypothetical protein
MQPQAHQRGYSAWAEHQPPAGAGRAAREGTEDDQRDDVGDQDADGDRPLLEHGQRPAPVLGRVLGDMAVAIAESAPMASPISVRANSRTAASGSRPT